MAPATQQVIGHLKSSEFPLTLDWICWPCWTPVTMATSALGSFNHAVPTPDPPSCSSGPCLPSLQSKNAPHSQGEYDVYSTFQSHEPEFDYLKSLEIEEKINKIKWLPQQNAAHSLLSTNGERPSLGARVRSLSMCVCWGLSVCVCVCARGPERVCVQAWACVVAVYHQTLFSTSLTG